MKTLTAKPSHNGFRVAYDGVVRGDARTFITLELCEQEINKLLVKDEREAVIYARPLLYTKG